MRIILSILLSLLLVGGAGAPAVISSAIVVAAERQETHLLIQDYLQRSYLELFELAPELRVPSSEIKRVEKLLEKAEKTCVTRFKDKRDAYKDQVKDAEKRLRKDTGQLSREERQVRHCELQHLRAGRDQMQTLAKTAIPVAYDNRYAKLKLLEQWPKDLRKILASIDDCTYHDREYGDVLDIGVRGVGDGQEDDIRIGREAVEQMQQLGAMPDRLENELIQTYVQRLTERLAAHSDLVVPVQVEVLDAPEVNAFALPGGFLFVQRGLLDAAADEAQLAGVLSHEIAHAAARHGNRMMGRARWSSLLFQVTQIVTSVVTGGVSSIAGYYGYQYAMMGLGMVLSLDLLGVTRDFELEADQLGVQYAWNAGYDTSGFIRFFDHMATTRGYVDGSSFFRTHPPFYERMVNTQREIMFLPTQDDPVTSSAEFAAMKAELEKMVTLAGEAEEHDAARPSDPVERCGTPDTVGYQPDPTIEALCASIN